MPTSAGHKKDHSERGKIGLWLVGACGGIGSTVALGLSALRRGWASDTGLVSALPVFRGLPLVDFDKLILGGHEIRAESLLEAVRGLQARANLFSQSLVDECAEDLRAIQRRIRPGIIQTADVREESRDQLLSGITDSSTAAGVERLASDILEFKRRENLERVIVVHVASAEPSQRTLVSRLNHQPVSRLLSKKRRSGLPTSSLYALAAVETSCAIINFTASTSFDLPSIRSRADELGVAYMGRDGKTGETLVKSVLAPLFAMRNLKVRSWFGQNILGNRDGAALRDPRARASKLRSKGRALSAILGSELDAKINIDFVQSLDDWKVAWDFIHFEGFLGTPMHLQFVWQGSDSILAAPLILDLARFAELHVRQGNAGLMRHLACFFKDPLETHEHNMHRQWETLLQAVGAGFVDTNAVRPGAAGWRPKSGPIARAKKPTRRV